MTKKKALRQALLEPGIASIMGAHSPLSARIAAEAGFDAVWASGLEISALAGVPDANILSMNQCLQAAGDMAAAVDAPVLADCDSGFGSVNNVADMVRRYERAGVAGVCIEDKLYPKLNSFVDGGIGSQDLAPVQDFVEKVVAATRARVDPDFVVVARIEALISGAGMAEALRRATAYEAAGADALLIHSKRDDPSEVYDFRTRYDGMLPLIVVPTTYHAVTAATLAMRGFAAVIYANHSMRGAIDAMQRVVAQIRRDDTAHHVEDVIAPLGRVFELQGVDAMLQERSYVEKIATQLPSAQHG